MKAGDSVRMKPAFLEWLRVHRFSAFVVLNGIVGCRFRGSNDRRFAVEFPGIDSACADHFDRQVDTSDAVIVIGYDEEGVSRNLDDYFEPF